MRGCLTLPFRLLALALILIGIILAWTYHDTIRRKIHAWSAEPAPSAGLGRAEPGRAGEVRRKLGGLEAGRDSVVLSASEVATLIAAGADARAPGVLDSIEVRLGPDEVRVRGWADTRPLGLGVASPVLRDREWVEVEGRLVYRRPGIAEWGLDRVRVRGFPVPHSAVERLVRRLSGTAAPGTVEIPLPARVTGLRTGPRGLVLYGGPRS
jgi:hypothetical protein